MFHDFLWLEKARGTKKTLLPVPSFLGENGQDRDRLINGSVEK
jgi:hypothetical protein